MLRLLVPRINEAVERQWDKIIEDLKDDTLVGINFQLERLKMFGPAAGDEQVTPQLRSTRCLSVKTKDNAGKEKVRWIFAANSEPRLMQLFGEMRERRSLKNIGIVLGFGHAPRSQAAKLVDQLTFGTKGKGKGKMADDDEDNGRQAARARK